VQQAHDKPREQRIDPSRGDQKAQRDERRRPDDRREEWHADPEDADRAERPQPCR